MEEIQKRKSKFLDRLPSPLREVVVIGKLGNVLRGLNWVTGGFVVTVVTAIMAVVWRWWLSWPLILQASFLVGLVFIVTGVIVRTSGWLTRRRRRKQVQDHPVKDDTWYPGKGGTIMLPQIDHEKLAAKTEIKEQGWRDEIEEFRILATTFWGTLGDIYDTEGFSHFHYDFPGLHTAVRTAWWPDAEHKLVDHEESVASAALDRLASRAYPKKGEIPGFGSSHETSDFDEIRQSISLIMKHWQRWLEGDESYAFRPILIDQLDASHACTSKLLWYIDAANAEIIGTTHTFGPHKALRKVFASRNPCAKPSTPDTEAPPNPKPSQEGRET